MIKKINKIMRIIIFLIIFFINMILFACGGNKSTEPKKDIVGKWESSDKTLTLEFTDQGKVKAVNRQGNFTNETTTDLIFIDDTHILGVWELNLATWEVNIYTDEMTLVRDGGEKIKFSKKN